MPFCPNCGRQIQEADTFCPSCGANLGRTAPVIPQNNPYSSSKHDGEVSSARTLTLAAMIVEAIYLVLIVISALGFGVFYSKVVANSPATTVATFPGTTVTYTNPFVSTGFAYGFVFIFLGVVMVVSSVWIVLDYLMIYKNLGSPNGVSNAKATALILGILQLLFGGLIPGILLIIAYLKIGESINNRRQMTTTTPTY